MKFKIITIPAAKNCKYFWVTFSIYFLFQFLSAVIVNSFNPELTSSGIQFDGLFDEFIIAVIVAPILETIVFQYLIIETLINLKLPLIMCIFVSALLFGFSHWYNFAYMAVLTGVGFIFAYYYSAIRDQNYFNKFLLVILLHSLSNFIVFIEKNHTYISNQISNIVS